MIVFLIFNVFVNFGAIAEVTQTSAIETETPISLPKCVDDPKTIEEIKASLRSNKKTKNKYSAYRKAFEGDTDTEIMARLAYSETIAARCPEMNDRIYPRIVSVINNRIQKRKGQVRDVVFQKDQFASSLNIYDESSFMDFLCPKNIKLWSQVFSESSKQLAEKTNSLSKDTVNYFLYKHSPRWTKAPWKFEEDTAGTSDSIQSCLRTFIVKNWK